MNTVACGKTAPSFGWKIFQPISFGTADPASRPQLWIPPRANTLNKRCKKERRVSTISRKRVPTGSGKWMKSFATRGSRIALRVSPHSPENGITAKPGKNSEFQKDQREEWAEHLELLKIRKPYRDFIFRRKTPDGICWVRSSGVPIFDLHDTFRGYRGTGNDITREMEIQDAASRANALLKSAIDGLNETCTLWDHDDKLLVFSEQFRAHSRQISAHIKPGKTFANFTRIALQSGIYAEAEGREEKWYRKCLRMHRNPIGQFEQERSNGT